MRRLLTFIVFIFMASSVHAVDNMTHVVFNLEASINGSHGKYEGEIWRVGKNRLKMKTSSGTSYGIDADAWHVDSSSKRAIHSYDEGPSTDIRVPLFQQPGEGVIRQTQPPYDRLEKLEFGTEKEFFRVNGNKQLKYQTVIGKFTLTLLLDDDTIPKEVLIAGPDYHLRYDYLTYEVLPIPDDNFFEPPQDLNYENVNN